MSHLQAIIFTVVKCLVMMDGALVLILLLYSRLAHLPKSRPGKWLVLSSVADIMVVSIFASLGILMEAIPLPVVLGVLIACGCYLAAVDFLKTGLLRKLPQGL